MPASKKKNPAKPSSSKINQANSIKTRRSTHSKVPYIVGIGASAGGLEAIEKFFSSATSHSGMAFIIVTHLDRTHTSLMPEIIKNYTEMPVHFIEDGLKVLPDNVYVIPPNANLDINNGFLHLTQLEETFNLPINYFFESLAEYAKEAAAAIILSGTGSDGSLGIKAIKCEGGLVVVQDPATAKYSGMPQSAINTGLADYVLPVEKMSAILIKATQLPDEVKEANISPELQQIFKILRTHTGHDFASYKLNTIYRRIERQMHAHHISSLADYVRFLRVHPNEINALFKDFLIGVTRFFRDTEAFDSLQNNILPKLLKAKPKDYCIRVWIPGCATGEEAYSLAILLRETLDKMKCFYKVQIFATDIDHNALDIARSGIYPDTISHEVTQDRLKRFFTKEKHTYKVKKDIREMIVFGVQNLIKDPPFTKLDLLCCRNLLIYFNAQLQKKLLPIFHFSLKPEGILFLGTSEAIAGYDDLFRLLDQKWKIFERKDVDAYPYSGFDFPTLHHHDLHKHASEIILNPEKTDLAESINHFLIDNYSPSCLIINKKGLILHSHGKAKRYIESASKKSADVNIFDIVSPKVKDKLALALRKSQLRKVTLNSVPIERPRGSSTTINFKLSPILDSVDMYGLTLIMVEEAITPKQLKDTKVKYSSSTRMTRKIIELEEDLQYSKENLQTSIEELQSSNEELQSTNEELQSTNEEIETSKEELQSLNEELVTVNSELQEKINQLASINDDMNNLFDSTEIMAIFLDNKLNIKRFTPRVKELIFLLNSDLGRSIRHFAINIKYDNILTDAAEVLRTLNTKTFEVQGKDNKYYFVKILPYKTLANTVDGIIITFTDINDYKKSENDLKESNKSLADSLNYTKCMFESIDQAILVVNDNLKILAVNRAFNELFNFKNEKITDEDLSSILDGHWFMSSLINQVETVFQKRLKKKQIIIEHDVPKLGPQRMVINACKVFNETLDTNTYLLIIEEN